MLQEKSSFVIAKNKICCLWFSRDLASTTIHLEQLFIRVSYCWCLIHEHLFNVITDLLSSRGIPLFKPCFISLLQHSTKHSSTIRCLKHFRRINSLSATSPTGCSRKVNLGNCPCLDTLDKNNYLVTGKTPNRCK